MLIAIAVVVAGIVLLIVSSIIMALQRQPEKGNVEVAVGGFIGFFPFGFFSSKKAFWMWLALAALSAVLIVIWLLSRKL